MNSASLKDNLKAPVTVGGTKEASALSDALDEKPKPKDVHSSQVDPENDIFIAAQYGDWQRIEMLIKQGKASATSKNDQGITPLHWAAINDRLLACKTLIDHGADVNAIGGDLNATPMMWAAKSGHTYIVHLLIQAGGDPGLTDNQGYNVLQLATHSSNVLLLIFLLHLDMPIDCVDPQGHTCLMWAAYQGDALSVEVLLSWGADVKISDHDGLTALHWAIVRGNRQCIEKVISEGADLSAKQNEGKTARSLAIELKTSKTLEAALENLGRDSESGVRLQSYAPVEWCLRAILILPSIYLGVVIELFSVAPIMISLPINGLLLYGMQQFTSAVLLPPHLRHAGIHNTPHLAGIFAASALWTLLHWGTKVLPSIGRLHPYLNALFGIILTLSLFCFFRAMKADPGFIPKHGGGQSEQREAIEELLRDGEFDSQHFCVHCLLRKPLRSKHCRICSRCVARHDHHCPWVNNCVGVRNHRDFMIYIVALFLGIPLYTYLMSLHLTQKGTVADPVECTLLAAKYCHWLQIDAFGILLTIWDCLQMTWVTMLVIVQFWQISRATTTQEVINIRRHGYMGGARDPPRRVPVASQIASVITSGTTDPAGASLDAASGGPTTACEHHNHSHGRTGRGGGFMKSVARLLGVDQFVDTAKEGLGTKAGRKRGRRVDNPFDGGVVSNCNDFWRVPSRDAVTSDGAGLVKRLPVDYYKLYAVPSATREMYARVPDGGDEV